MMKDISIKQVLIIVIASVFSVLLLPSSIVPVLAEEVVTSTKLPVHCEWEKGNYKPTQTLVIVTLDPVLTTTSGINAEDLASGLFYETAYVRGNKTSPFNAVIVGREMAYATCNLADYTANVSTGVEDGVFVLGVYGDYSKAKLQQFITEKGFTAIKMADLNITDAEKNTTFALGTLKKCDASCSALVPVKASNDVRKYTLEIGSPNYSTSVKQREQLSFSVKIKNTSNYPIYESGINSLQVAPVSKGLSPLYHSSWVSTNIVATLPGILYPGKETLITATLGAPLMYGKYDESMQFKVDNRVVGNLFKISFTVEKDNLKLAKIVPKGGEPYANLRATPALNGQVTGRLGAGTYVIITGYQDAWVKIETKEGKIGWVYKPSIREL